MFKNYLKMGVVLGLVCGQLAFSAKADPVKPASLPTTQPDANALPQGNAALSTVDRKLNPGDFLEIKVYQEDELGTKIYLDDKGTVMLPLLGKIVLGGLTIEQATDVIQKAYGKDYLKNPQVNITVITYTKKYFSVLGQVANPNTFEMPNNSEVNILSAIAQAGGISRLGNPNKVYVRRVIDGKTQKIKVDGDFMAKGNNSDPLSLFKIEPGDIVYVEERAW